MLSGSKNRHMIRNKAMSSCRGEACIAEVLAVLGPWTTTGEGNSNAFTAHHVVLRLKWRSKQPGDVWDVGTSRLRAYVLAARRQRIVEDDVIRQQEPTHDPHQGAVVLL